MYLFAINFNVSDVVLKHSWDVDFWELILTEDDEQTGLTTRTIPNYHQLLPDSSHLQKSVRNKVIACHYFSLRIHTNIF